MQLTTAFNGPRAFAAPLELLVSTARTTEINYNV